MLHSQSRKRGSHFSLAEGVKYRRESFGGIVFLPTTMTSNFFNHSASWAIEQFGLPIELSTVESLLSKMVNTPTEISELIHWLIASGIIKEFQPSKNQIGRVFFTNITDFSIDRLHVPLGVECELTLRCMRQCTYCAYESRPDIRTIGELREEDWSNLLAQLDECGIFYVRFTGGDPLTRADAIRILQKASTLGFGVSIASDLTVLTAEQAEKLASVENLLYLQTTLDGPNPIIADSQRGHGNFHKVIRGLDTLKQFHIPVAVGTVVTKLNAKHIGEIATLLSQWDNIVGYCISPLYAAGRGRALKDLIPSEDDLALAYELFGEAVTKAVVKPLDPAWNLLAASATSEERGKFWADQPNLVRSPDRLLRIDPYGRAYTSIHVKEALGDEIYIGNVLTSSIMELWNNSEILNKFRALRKSHPYFGDIFDIRSFQPL